MSMILSKLNEMGPIGRGTGIRPLPHGEVAYGFIPGTEQIGVAAVCLAEKSFWYARTAEDIDPDTFAPIDIESPQLAATMAKTPDAMRATTAYISQQTGLKEIHEILLKDQGKGEYVFIVANSGHVNSFAVYELDVPTNAISINVAKNDSAEQTQLIRVDESNFATLATQEQFDREQVDSTIYHLTLGLLESTVMKMVVEDRTVFDDQATPLSELDSYKTRKAQDVVNIFRAVINGILTDPTMDPIQGQTQYEYGIHPWTLNTEILSDNPDRTFLDLYNQIGMVNKDVFGIRDANNTYGDWIKSLVGVYKKQFEIISGANNIDFAQSDLVRIMAKTINDILAEAEPLVLSHRNENDDLVYINKDIQLAIENYIGQLQRYLGRVHTETGGASFLQ